MALYLGNHETAIRRAVKLFWTGMEAARVRQRDAGKSDQGERAAVTAGKNMNGFIELMADVVRGNGLKSAQIHLQRRLLTLPGFFRPTKLWDMLVMNDGKLIAALEFKSQVGPSFGTTATTEPRRRLGMHTTSGQRIGRMRSVPCRDHFSAGSCWRRMLRHHASR
jgi:hypothetical protein